MFIKSLKLGYLDPNNRDFEGERLELHKDPQEGYYVIGQLRNITGKSIYLSRLDIDLGSLLFSADYYIDINIDENVVQEPNQWPPGVSLSFTTGYVPPSAVNASALKNIEHCFIKAVPPRSFP
jgi:hypothetical protein